MDAPSATIRYTVVATCFPVHKPLPAVPSVDVLTRNIAEHHRRQESVPIWCHEYNVLKLRITEAECERRAIRRRRTSCSEHPS